MLQVVRKLNSRIEREKERLKWLESLIGSNSLRYTEGRTQSSSSKVERLAVSITDTENLISELAVIRDACAMELLELLQSRLVSNKVLRVMIERYCLCKSFAEIAAATGYTERQIYRLHELGLKNVSRMSVECQLNVS